MKLRNKKTGEIWDIGKVLTNDYPSYDTLEQITEDFEDYNSPLIKDEKIRKAVRAWAEANEAFWASTYKSCGDRHYWYIRAFTERGIDIDFGGELPKELIDCKCYTIAELCGEEENERL